MNYFSQKKGKEKLLLLHEYKNTFKNHSILSYRPLLEVYFKEKDF